MKLTITEARLVAQAARRGGRHSVDCASGQGSRGGRVSTGFQQVDALNRLVRRGLARITDRRPSTVVHHGYTIRCTTLRFELTGEPT